MKLRTSFAYNPADDEEIRVQKSAILLVAGACVAAGVVWTAMYYVIFGQSLTTLLPFSFVVIVGLALVVSHIARNHWFAVYAQIICIIFVPVFIQWSVGGVFESGLVIVWAFLGPLIALMFFSLRQSIFWTLIYLSTVVITVVFNGYFASQGQAVAQSTRLFLLLMNLTFASTVVFAFAGYFVTSEKNERAKANKLLLNVLPKEIAPILKDGQKSIAERFESASVLFADIVGSTPLFSELEPEEAVDWLNDVFSMFDALVEKYGLEKIRTVGDNYMVAAGVPVRKADHALAISNLALDMVQQLGDMPARNGKRLDFRMGINSGPLVAGVIGQSKFHYDIYGDAVNVASRMESHGVAGRVQVSEATYELLKDDFDFEARGRISVKGKDDMETWFLVGRKAPLGV